MKTVFDTSALSAGLGLRRGLMLAMAGVDLSAVSFMEIAPENWIKVGGHLETQLRDYAERFPFIFHDLSLSLGSPDPLDYQLLKDIRRLMDELDVAIYSEHLSACSVDGHLYNLMPIPMTQASVRYVADRIKAIQDFMGQPLVIENISAYLQPGQEMPEVEFLNQILALADCQLLLDINNLYVNSVNFNFDPVVYLKQISANRIVYCHIAGHYDESESLLIDTHGSSVKKEVWDLLKLLYQIHGIYPTLLERDFNYPPVSELLLEINKIRECQAHALAVQVDLTGTAYA